MKNIALLFVVLISSCSSRPSIPPNQGDNGIFFTPDADNFPLSLWVEGPDRDIVEEGVKEINYVFNRDLFRMAASSKDYDYLVETGVPRERMAQEMWIGSHSPRGRSGSYGIIKLREDTPQRQSRAIVLHELGHCLGLGHDQTNPQSVMYPTITGAVGFEPRDIELIQTLVPLR